MPVPRSARSVLLVGGTFDPPHRAHLDLPRAARDLLLGTGAWLVYVPAARSPHKSAGPVASDDDRVTMLRAALRGVPRSRVWTDELDRGPGPSFWIDTIGRALRAAPPGCSVRFVIGADQAAAFHRWKRPREILEFASPIVLLRAPFRTAASLMRALRATGEWSKPELEQWASWIAPGKLMRDSSTGVRSGLAARRKSVLDRVPSAVSDIIRRRGLYTPPTSQPSLAPRPCPSAPRRRTRASARGSRA